MSYIVIEWIAANLEEARTVAGEIISKKLAACINILPSVESYFSWEGQITQANEVCVFIKTREELWENIRDYICEKASYTVPSLLSWKVLCGTSSYLHWVAQVTELNDT